MKQNGINEGKNSSALTFDGGQAFAGGFIILMGGIALLGALGVTVLGRSAWWLMALIPVYWIAVTAYRYFRQDGRISRRVFAVMVWGLLPFAYVAGSALDLNVGAIWPLGFIAVGIGMLLYGSGK
jgi:hypothetical protein